MEEFDEDKPASEYDEKVVVDDEDIDIIEVNGELYVKLPSNAIISKNAPLEITKDQRIKCVVEYDDGQDARIVYYPFD